MTRDDRSDRGVREEGTISAPGAVRWIVESLEDEGYETWTVGGAVRDALVGREGGDWDFTTRARPGEIRRVFRRTVPIGIDHGTVGVLDRRGRLYEVTTFRRDVETNGRHAVVAFADTVEEDLARRDFTINAIAWHPLREELRDPFGGRDDLEARVLRTVGEPERRFAEDFLRVLRALRFSGRFGLRVAEGTWRALCRALPGLDRLSPERIREELMKVLSGVAPPSRTLGLYAFSGALRRFAPELDELVGHPRPDGGPGELWSQALLTVDAISPARPRLRLGALLRGIGVPDRSPGHDDQGLGVAERGARRAAALLGRLRFSNAETDRVAALVRGSSEPPEPDGEGASLRRWLARHDRELIPDLTRIGIADARIERRRGREEVARRAVDRWRALRRELRADPPLSREALALDGSDLIRMGFEPGPHFGRILDRLLERVLDEPRLNRREILEEIVAGEVRGEE